jgi:hypothetical protein
MTTPRDRYISNTIFTRLPGWVTYGPGISGYSGSELKVLIHICSKADNRTNKSIVTREEISRNTKVSLGSISGILSVLVMYGVIRIEKDGRRNIYHVQFVPPESWPHGIPTNAARARAAEGRRAVLSRNLAASSLEPKGSCAKPWNEATTKGCPAKEFHREEAVD